MGAALGQRLSERYRVLLIDRPGHGWSKRGGGQEAGTPRRQAALLHEALQRLGISSVVLVAHSWGGALATAYALDHPQGVTGLVLLAPLADAWTDGIPWYFQLGAIPLLGPLFAHTLALPAGILLIHPAVQFVFFPQLAPPDYMDRSAAFLALRPSEVLATAGDIAGLNTVIGRQAARYADITAPTVIISGNRDAIVSPRLHARALSAALPHAKLVMLGGIGHMPHYAAPDRVVEAVTEMAEGKAKPEPN
jgi:pimeloyl-ACP methyl ester carboxylesterase